MTGQAIRISGRSYAGLDQEAWGQKVRMNGIAEESVVDGPGIRYTLFVQGCPHGCRGCHNPQTHLMDGGYETTIDQLFSAIRGNPLVTGVTFSGGEPMCQAKALSNLAYRIKETGLSIAVYSGYTLEELLRENDEDRMRLLSLCSILIDGRFEEEKRDLALVFRGSSNQRILDLKRSLALRSPVFTADPAWIRNRL